MPERKINLEEILTKVFEPSPQDCSTPSQDLQLAVTLNPDISRIKEAMKEACKQVLELAAENAELDTSSIKPPGLIPDIYNCSFAGIDALGEELWYSIDKQSILNTINQIE